mmetsp:Transcript_60713/g.131572  ORF Transcript_60713/g.131572 Transcript_60713/m.131572 type:complete len:229 (-) Transcript_60713:35-721(-)
MRHPFQVGVVHVGGHLQASIRHPSHAVAVRPLVKSAHEVFSEVRGEFRLRQVRLAVEHARRGVEIPLVGASFSFHLLLLLRHLRGLKLRSGDEPLLRTNLGDASSSLQRLRNRLIAEHILLAATDKPRVWHRFDDDSGPVDALERVVLPSGATGRHRSPVLEKSRARKVTLRHRSTLAARLSEGPFLDPVADQRAVLRSRFSDLLVVGVIAELGRGHCAPGCGELRRT